MQRRERGKGAHLLVHLGAGIADDADPLGEEAVVVQAEQGREGLADGGGGRGRGRVRESESEGGDGVSTGSVYEGLGMRRARRRRDQGEHRWRSASVARRLARRGRSCVMLVSSHSWDSCSCWRGQGAHLLLGQVARGARNGDDRVVLELRRVRVGAADDGAGLVLVGDAHGRGRVVCVGGGEAGLCSCELGAETSEMGRTRGERRGVVTPTLRSRGRDYSSASATLTVLPVDPRPSTDSINKPSRRAATPLERSGRNVRQAARAPSSCASNNTGRSPRSRSSCADRKQLQPVHCILPALPTCALAPPGPFSRSRGSDPPHLLLDLAVGRHPPPYGERNLRTKTRGCARESAFCVEAAGAGALESGRAGADERDERRTVPTRCQKASPRTLFLGVMARELRSMCPTGSYVM